VNAGARIVPVILSGGAGTRLWPLSTPERPKQFHALTGTETMLRMTAARVADRMRFAPPIVVASAANADAIDAQLDDIGALILEPVGRNTAPAIALAALRARTDELLLVMPSDHVIADPGAFQAAIDRAAAAAAQGWLMTFGIAPDRPETGYGYIKRGAALGDGAFAVERFVEKPDSATAAAYLAAGGHDWNGGIFLFRAADLLAGLEAHAPDILAATRQALAAGQNDGRRITPDPALFAAVRAQSIDHALMEKHDRVGVAPVAMGWSDLGSWDALYALGGKDAGGNAASGPARLIDTSGTFVHSTGPRIVTVGVSDLIVVATGDTVLILPRGESQRVREAAASTEL